jgi:hypothetical protein
MRSFVRYSMLVGSLIPALACAFTPISLSLGWNLVGNSDPAAIDVASKLNGSQITTVWKWNKVQSRWAFYTPTMSSSALLAYAASKGYDVLSTIDSKEGFWVNASAAVTISDLLAPPPAIGSVVTLSATDLVTNWNLMASADKKTPSQLNAGLASSLTAASKSISTVWAWDAPSSSWRFYAPSLEANGQLSSYITSKTYLPFASVLAATDGFWVNIGMATPVVVPPSPSANLRTLTYTSASDWLLRVNSSTSAQNTPAADGSYRWRETRMAKVAGGAPYSWTSGSSPSRGADIHWSGTSWANCPVNFENWSSAKDASGNTTYNYCNGRETGSSVGNAYNTVDISTRRMIDVYNEAVAAGNTNLTITYADALLGSATFPTGSKVSYNTFSSNYLPAVAYYPGASNFVMLTDAGVAAGNSTSCNASPWPAENPNATLEQLIAANKGTPCVYGVNTVIGANGITLTSGSRNEGWGGTTLSLGSVGSAPTYSSAANTSSWYTTNTRYRVGFGTGNAVNFYSCQESWGGNTRNCDVIGSGTYAIQTLGDGRKMTFSGYPTQFSALNWSRVFVERGGHVFYGYQDKPMVSTPQARLNLTGLSALFSTLGLPAFSPDVPIVLSLGSYAGTYSSTFTGTDSGTVTSSISPSGATTCSGISVQAGAFACSFNVTPTGTDGTTAAVSLGISGTGAIFSGTANYYTGAVTGTWRNTGGAVGTFTGSRQ